MHQLIIHFPDYNLVGSDKFLSAVPKLLLLIVTLIVNVILLLATACQFRCFNHQQRQHYSQRCTTVVTDTLSQWDIHDNFLSTNFLSLVMTHFHLVFKQGPLAHPILFFVLPTDISGGLDDQYGGRGTCEVFVSVRVRTSS